MHHNDELVDLVNEQDSVIATIWRSEASLKKDLHEQKIYRRAVLTFLMNHEGKLCILRRTAHKDYMPFHWAIVGGCVQSAESYEKAAERETVEEVNLIMNENNSRLLGFVTPQEHGFAYFKKVYEISIDQDEVAYNTDDFCEHRWLFPEQICTFIQEGTEPVVPDLEYLIRRFYLS